MAKEKRKAPEKRKRPTATRRSVSREPVVVRGQARGALRFVPAQSDE